MVTDDEVIIGNQVFGEDWKDDSTTIYFDGDCQNIAKPYFVENDSNPKSSAPLHTEYPESRG